MVQKKIPLPILVFAGLLIVASVFTAGFACALVIDRHTGNTAVQSNGAFDLFWEAWALVQKDFYGDVPSDTQLTYSALRGALASLDDPYTLFVEPQPREMERDSLRGSFGGIGAYVSVTEDGDFVLAPIEGQPAEAAGVLEGDVLLAVNGEPLTAEMTVDEVVLAIRGPVGEEVTITVRHPAEEAPVDITIVRAIIELPSANWERLPQDPTIGYIHLNRFSERSADEVETAIRALRETGADKLILDLRYNGGGLLTGAVDVLDLFLGAEVVLYQRESGGKETRYRTTAGGVALDTPLVVLINGGTASASEIVAGALQDLDRAKLIGDQTFGKASVQNVYDLSDGSSLHVTSSRWFTPKRRQLDGEGLTPDFPIGLDDSGIDRQLERAATVLQMGQ